MKTVAIVNPIAGYRRARPGLAPAPVIFRRGRRAGGYLVDRVARSRGNSGRPGPPGGV